MEESRRAVPKINWERRPKTLCFQDFFSSTHGISSSWLIFDLLFDMNSLGWSSKIRMCHFENTLDLRRFQHQKVYLFQVKNKRWKKILYNPKFILSLQSVFKKQWQKKVTEFKWLWSAPSTRSRACQEQADTSQPKTERTPQIVWRWRNTILSWSEWPFIKRLNNLSHGKEGSCNIADWWW